MTDSLDKLITKLADWLLFNHGELEQAILATDYQGNSDWEREYIRYRSRLDSDVERFVTSQDYHLNIILVVKSSIFSLNSEYFDMYVYRYEERKLVDQIANLISVNERTVRRMVADIREHTWADLESEGIVLENVAGLRTKYNYIPRKEK
jgi:hypothetical protein